jgi:tetratricopeptide (TPR) repeat protein
MGARSRAGPHHSQLAMTLTQNNFLAKLVVTVAVFAAALTTFVLVNRGSGTTTAGNSGGVSVPPNASTDARIAAYQQLVRSHPKDSRSYDYLGGAYMQKVRETGDASFYTRADGVFSKALQLNPRDPDAVTGAGTLALSRHDFAGALQYGQRAHQLAPYSFEPLGVIVDAQVELGRYADAQRSLQAMINLRPNLSSYARVSYFRELHGDLSGAIDAMKLAVSASGGTPENVAYVQTLLGNLYFTEGRLNDARDAYGNALESFPGYVPATAGLASVSPVRRALRLYSNAVARLPLPQYVIALGELQQAAGKRPDYDLVRAEERLLQANGVNTDVDLALFEANHGSPARAVSLARRARAEAPSVRSADALGWALTSAGHPAQGLRWARRALVLGSRDPLFLYHAGMSAKAAGRAAVARAYLSESLALNPRFSPLYAPRAERALKELGA